MACWYSFRAYDQRKIQLICACYQKSTKIDLTAQRSPAQYITVHHKHSTGSSTMKIIKICCTSLIHPRCSSIAIDLNRFQVKKEREREKREKKKEKKGFQAMVKNAMGKTTRKAEEKSHLNQVECDHFGNITN